MGSAQLAKLEGLSEKLADQSRKTVDRSRDRLAQLDQHRNELKSITREYQRTPEQGVMFTSKLLAHRRAFVTQLTEKLDALNLQREQQQETLDEQVLELRDRTAQSSAIGAIQKARQRNELLATARVEQHEQDEALRRVENPNRSDSEDPAND